MPHKFHNPNNFGPHVYQAEMGWRLLTVQELDCYPMAHVEYTGGGSAWHLDCVQPGQSTPQRNLTYRTKAPLPPELDEDPLTAISRLVGAS